MPHEERRMRNSTSEVKIECAREKRLMIGFETRVLSGKNRDLFNDTGQDDTR